VVLGLSFAIPVAAQNHQSKTRKDKSERTISGFHHEAVEGEYINIPTDQMPKSLAYRDEGTSWFTTQVNITDVGENIVGDAANEPSIAVDPTNPDKMVIGWRQFNTITSNFRQAGYAYTEDGGDTWTFPGVIDPGVFRSDPVLDADVNGNIYYNSLTSSGSVFSCDVFKMEEGEVEWDEGTFALGGDKQWMIVDRNDNMGEGHHYAFWTSSFSYCPPYQFTRSVDDGDSYEDCVFVAGIPRWGTLATASDGALFTGGWGDDGYIVSRSSTAMNPDWPVTWDGHYVVDLDGSPGFGAGPNPGGLLGQVWVGVDASSGPFSGNVYLLSSVERYSNNDPLDVMFSRSTDNGVTWEDPVRINQDINTTNWQWFGTMSVSPDGRIDVVWLDTRDSETNYYSSLYYTYSADGGQTFAQDLKISDTFNPHLGWPQQDKMGDYFHMVSDNDYAHLAWANTLNGEQDVYYTRINPWFVGIENEKRADNLSVKVYPNPVDDKFSIRVHTKHTGSLEICVIDMVGNEVRRFAEPAPATGVMQKTIETTSLPGSVYYVKVEVGGERAVRKLIVSH
jgi:hypothetical protein